MRPSCGGEVNPKLVVGRDKLIARMWRILETQSILLLSARRVGKTTVIGKMSEEPRSGWTAIRMLVESIHSPMEFVARTVELVSPILSKRNRAFNKLQVLYEELSGLKIMDFTLPQLKGSWKRLLRRALADIRDNFDQNVLLIWDEFPLMIDNIRKSSEPEQAMELLDLLREERQYDKDGRLRMIYTGSIGLHLVISDLKDKGYINDPVNDMHTELLGPLDPEFAEALAIRNIQGFQDDDEIHLADPVAEIAKQISVVSSGLPYYIDLVADRLAEMNQPTRVEDVDTAVNWLISHPGNLAHFRHYAERIEKHYKSYGRVKDVALAVLNALSKSQDRMSEGDLEQWVATKCPAGSVSQLLEALDLMLSDDYITRENIEGNRLYEFKYEIIKRWWSAQRA